MPKIKNPIRFSAESLDIIEKKLSSPDFKHTNWGDDDLQVLRAEIRNHYREEQKLECVYCHEPIGVRAAQAAPVMLPTY